MTLIDGGSHLGATALRGPRPPHPLIAEQLPAACAGAGDALEQPKRDVEAFRITVLGMRFKRSRPMFEGGLLEELFTGMPEARVEQLTAP